MAQRKPEKVTVDQVLKLVEQLSPEEQGELRRKLDESWSAEWRALLKEVDDRNKDAESLSEEEIMAKVKAVREETVRPKERLKIGSELAAFGDKYKLDDLNIVREQDPT